MLDSVVQADCEAILLLTNMSHKHSGILLLLKNCLLLAVLLKNDAYWSVSASDHLL